MGFLIGNEMIGAGALLLVCGGSLFEKSGAQNMKGRGGQAITPNLSRSGTIQFPRSPPGTPNRAMLTGI